MRTTKRQEHLLRRVDEIVCRTKAGGVQRFFLAKDDCTLTVHSLIVKGLLRLTADNRALYRTNLPPLR